jgi:hypothetical protein
MQKYIYVYSIHLKKLNFRETNTTLSSSSVVDLGNDNMIITLVSCGVSLFSLDVVKGD